MNGVGVVHIVFACISCFLCFLAYRIGYSSAESKLRNEIHSREKILAKTEGELYQRERLLTENVIKLQSDTKQFEADRLRRIDNQVQELFDKTNNELQCAYNNKNRELREYWREEGVKLQELFDKKSNNLQLEFDSKRKELREKYRTARDKLQSDNAVQAQALSSATNLANIAEAEFRAEYEKWLQRNRPSAGNDTEIELSPEQMLAFGYITNTKKNIFIQGQAGTGKSTLVKFLKMQCKKKMILASPTGAAAYIIGGATINSVFSIPPKDFIDISKRTKTDIWSATDLLLREAELVVIDEVSMVNPNILDVIDWTAKTVRGNSLPFGGLQVVLIGDLFQLPPVIKNNVKALFEILYGHENAYFFDAPSFKSGDFLSLTLSAVFRQNDSELLLNLDRILKQKDINETLEYFNSARIADDESLDAATSLTPTNKAADKINKIRLLAVGGPLRMYKGIVNGIFKLRDAPARPKLELKVGALVVFTNNHFSIRNGTSAIVTDLGEDTIRVRLIEKGMEIEVERDKWKNIKYKINRLTKEIEEEEIGSYSQFPIQLGYAMTIHKAQGRTLDKAIIEKMHSRFFTHGHLYVALSRTRMKSDMHVAEPLTSNDILLDGRIVELFKNPEPYGFRRLSVAQN